MILAKVTALALLAVGTLARSNLTYKADGSLLAVAGEEETSTTEPPSTTTDVPPPTVTDGPLEEVYCRWVTRPTNGESLAIGLELRGELINVVFRSLEATGLFPWTPESPWFEIGPLEEIIWNGDGSFSTSRPLARVGYTGRQLWDAVLLQNGATADGLSDTLWTIESAGCDPTLPPPGSFV